MKSATEQRHLQAAARSLYAASIFSLPELSSEIAQHATPHLNSLFMPGSKLYEQWSQGLISTYEYAVGVSELLVRLHAEMSVVRKAEAEEIARQQASEE